MAKLEYKPRLSIEITEEQFIRKGKVIPWGMETKIFGVLLDGVLNLMENPETRSIIMENILSKNINAKHVLRAGGIFGLKESKT